MKILSLLLQVLSFFPTCPRQEVRPQGLPRPSGFATVFLVDCPPGETVVINPGGISAAVPENGNVTVRVPAQARSDAPYEVVDVNGSVPLNGTVDENHIISGVCPQ